MQVRRHAASDGGRFRTKEISVRDDRRCVTVYEWPGPADVPALMRALSGTRAAPQSDDPLVQGAMAHLNRVMIHPFGDGNGRMARALHAMEMAQDQVVEQTFCSIEEWLANITQDLYDVLAATGCGSWQSGNDAKLWVKFKLSAHHMQAKTMRRPFNETEPRWRLLRSCLRSTS